MTRPFCEHCRKREAVFIGRSAECIGKTKRPREYEYRCQNCPQHAKKNGLRLEWKRIDWAFVESIREADKTEGND